MKRPGYFLLLAAGALALTGCSSGSDDPVATYNVGVNVTGLPLSDAVVLQNNGGDDLNVTVDGTATFSKSLTDGSSYHVTVKTQPADTGRICGVVDPIGTIGAGNAQVTVECGQAITLSGSVQKSDTGSTLGNVPIEVRNAADDSVLATALSQNDLTGIHGNFSISAPSEFFFYLHSSAIDIEGTQYLGSSLQIENEVVDQVNLKFYLVDSAMAAAMGTTIGADLSTDATFGFDVEDNSGGLAGVTVTTTPAVTTLLYNQDDTGSNFSATPPTTNYNQPSVIGYLHAPASPTTVTFTLDPEQAAKGYTIDTTFKLRLIAGEISSPIEP